MPNLLDVCGVSKAVRGCSGSVRLSGIAQFHGEFNTILSCGFKEAVFLETKLAMNIDSLPSFLGTKTSRLNSYFKQILSDHFYHLFLGFTSCEPFADNSLF